MKKIFSIGMLWLLISFCLQAETMVVATFNIRNVYCPDGTIPRI